MDEGEIREPIRQILHRYIDLTEGHFLAKCGQKFFNLSLNRSKMLV